MKKKHKRSKLEHIQGLDNIFSEIDVKENTMINTNNDNFKLYSLDILSDNSDSDNDSIDLNDYDLETETIQKPIISVSNNTITVNTEDFFNCLLDIDNNQNKELVEKKKIETQLEQEKNDNFKIQYINDMSDLINIIPEKLIVKKENHTESKKTFNQDNQDTNNIIKDTTIDNQNNQDTNNIIKDTTIDNQNNQDNNNIIKDTTIDNQTKQDTNDIIKNTELNNENKQNTNDIIKNTELNNENNSDIKNLTITEDVKDLTNNNKKKDIKDITTSQKNDIWGDLKTNMMTSYNYLCSESGINDFLVDNIKLKQFYNEAKNNNKNTKGYIENDNIINASLNIDYPYEIYTKLGDVKTIDPPGNYINIFLVKNLDIVKRLYILYNSGYWLLEPLENYKKLLQNQHTKKILKIYFIILKLLYCNKHYPFDTGDCIKKYKNLIKNINLNLIINYINNDKDFKEYINNQLNTVFSISENIDDLINIFMQNNMNKYYTNILKLKYINY